MTGRRWAYGHAPGIDSAKTLQDQINEIEKLISDAQQELRQASYALETLKDRVTAILASPQR